MEKTQNLNEYPKLMTREESDYAFYRSFQNWELIDAASNLKYSNFIDKINYVICPGIVGSEKNIARNVLEERGVNWKTRQVTRYNAIKRADKIYWNNVKNELIAPWRALCKNFYNILKMHSYKK